MKRLVKFRGKNARRGWLTGYYFVNRGVHYIAADGIVNPIRAPEDFEVDPNTVGQSLGLVDRNNKEIYEGDIAKVFGEKTRYCVTYNPYCCMFVATPYDDNGKPAFGGKEINYPLIANDGFTVIGNIYDNPELLKGDK